jgi:hypothetical protein
MFQCWYLASWPIHELLTSWMRGLCANYFIHITVLKLKFKYSNSLNSRLSRNWLANAIFCVCEIWWQNYTNLIYQYRDVRHGQSYFWWLPKEYDSVAAPQISISMCVAAMMWVSGKRTSIIRSGQNTNHFLKTISAELKGWGNSCICFQLHAPNYRTAVLQSKASHTWVRLNACPKTLLPVSQIQGCQIND